MNIIHVYRCGIDVSLSENSIYPQKYRQDSFCCQNAVPNIPTASHQSSCSSSTFHTLGCAQKPTIAGHPWIDRRWSPLKPARRRGRRSMGMCWLVAFWEQEHVELKRQFFDRADDE